MSQPIRLTIKKKEGICREEKNDVGLAGRCRKNPPLAKPKKKKKKGGYVRLLRPGKKGNVTDLFRKTSNRRYIKRGRRTFWGKRRPFYDKGTVPSSSFQKGTACACKKGYFKKREGHLYEKKKKAVRPCKGPWPRAACQRKETHPAGEKTPPALTSRGKKERARLIARYMKRAAFNRTREKKKGEALSLSKKRATSNDWKKKYASAPLSKGRKSKREAVAQKFPREGQFLLKKKGPGPSKTEQRRVDQLLALGAAGRCP